MANMLPVHNVRFDYDDDGDDRDDDNDDDGLLTMQNDNNSLNKDANWMAWNRIERNWMNEWLALLLNAKWFRLGIIKS